MYASYFYNAGATVATVLGDIKDILTGVTTPASLSAACNKAQTTITNAVSSSNWTLHDAAAGVNAMCFKSVISDDATISKYLVIDMNTSGYILTKVYDSWSATTHLPGLNALGLTTNLHYWSDSTSYCQRWPVTGTAPNLTASLTGRLDISCSPYHVLLFSFQNSAYGSATNLGPCGIMERTRRSPWDTIAMGRTMNYRPVVWGNLGLFATASTTFTANILPNNFGVDQIGGAAGNVNCGASVVTPLGANTGIGVTALHQVPATIVPNSVLVPQHILIPFGVIQPTYGFLGGDISSLCDVWLTTYGYGGAFDEVSLTGATYVIWTANTTYRIAVRKG